MIRKSLVLVAVTSLTLVLALAVSETFAEGEKGPAEINLNAEGKKPAVFPHAAHQAKNECGICHHFIGDDGKQTPIDAGSIDKIEQCATCHNAEFQNEKLRTWKDIGHAQCKDCHTAMKDQGAPTKCTDCHLEKAPAGSAKE